MDHVDDVLDRADGDEILFLQLPSRADFQRDGHVDPVDAVEVQVVHELGRRQDLRLGESELLHEHLAQARVDLGLGRRRRAHFVRLAATNAASALTDAKWRRFSDESSWVRTPYWSSSAIARSSESMESSPRPSLKSGASLSISTGRRSSSISVSTIRRFNSFSSSLS